MHDIHIAFPTLMMMRSAIAAVWMYEGVWNKLLDRAPSQSRVVSAVPWLGKRFGGTFLKALGIVEAALALWVLSGVYPGTCAAAQVVLLVCLNVNGLLWARHLIHDPGGMVLKNAAFLILAWTCGAASGVRP